MRWPIFWPAWHGWEFHVRVSPDPIAGPYQVETYPAAREGGCIVVEV